MSFQIYYTAEMFWLPFLLQLFGHGIISSKDCSEYIFFTWTGWKHILILSQFVLFFPPNRLKISAPFKLNNKKYYSSLLCYFSYLFAFFVCSSIYLNAWLTWHDFHMYFCHFTKINTIYNVELFFNLCYTERDRMLDIFYETNEKISSSISLQSILKKESYLLTHLLSDIVFQFTKPRHVSEEASSLAPWYLNIRVLVMTIAIIVW